MKFSTCLLTVAAASGAIAGPLNKQFLPDVAQVKPFYTTGTVGSETNATSAAPIPPAGNAKPQKTKRRICKGRKPSSKTSAETMPAPNDPATPVYINPAPVNVPPPVLANPAVPGGGPLGDEPQNSNDGGISNGDTSSGDPFIAASLKHHNVHRANHSAADLKWNTEIAGYAATTAATCRFGHNTQIGGGGYGQNIAMWGSTGDVSESGEVAFIGQSITEMWYNGELELFNGYGQDQPDMSNFRQWGHFTQIVWKKTTSVGCHVQYCPPGTMSPNMGAFFSVCNYFPPGNVGGAYKENVGRPLGQPVFNAD